MKTPIKIILLAVAMLLAVTGVMAYYRTQVAPPKEMAIADRFYKSATEDIDRVNDKTADINLDSVFVAITHKLDFQMASSLLTKEQRDSLMRNFVNYYAERYALYCNDEFGKSVWNEATLQNMKSHTAALLALRTTGGKPCIGSEQSKDVARIQGIVANYYAAKAVSAAGGYQGLASARARIAAARRYAAMSPINNCVALRSQLQSVATRLEQAHFAYLSAQVERLRNYYNYNETSYDNLALSISEKLEEYKNNARSVYGRVSNVAALEDRAGNYYSNASFN